LPWTLQVGPEGKAGKLRCMLPSMGQFPRYEYGEKIFVGQDVLSQSQLVA